MTNDMVSGKLSIIRFVVRTKVLFFMRTSALTKNKFSSDLATGCDRNDEGLIQPD